MKGRGIKGSGIKGLLDGARSLAGPRLTVVRNTASLLVMRLGVPMLSTALMFVLSRKLGPEGVGRYTLAYTFLYFASAVAPLGLQPVLTREGARSRDRLDALLASASVVGFGASLITALGVAAIAWHSGYDPETRLAILLATLTVVPGTVAVLLEGSLAAIQRMDYTLICALSEAVVRVGGGIVALLGGYGLAGVMIAAVLARAVYAVQAALLLRREGIRLRVGVERRIVENLLKLAPTFVLIAVVAALYWRINIVMLSQSEHLENLGLYGAAWRLLELAMVLPQSLCLAVYPNMAALAKSDMHAVRKLGDSTIRTLLLCTIPLAVAVTLTAPWILRVLYGQQFVGAAATLSVLVWTIVPYSIVRYQAYALIAVERQGGDLLMNGIMAAVTIAANLALIPRYGALGAAMATLGSIVVYALLQYEYLRRWAPTVWTPIRLGRLLPRFAQETRHG
ncbi:MAG TPA: flippase [Candidatus Binatia bacterium]|nr:flippase [Candidatus Binatia bacterium]